MTLPTSGAISFYNINAELGYSNTAQLSLGNTAVRTLFGIATGPICMNSGHGKSNTSVPGAPTIGTATVTSSSSATISFTAPTCTGHLSIDYYQAISTPGCITATGSSPISVTGLTPSTSYTFKVRAHNSLGYGAYSSSSSSVTTSALRGCTVYGAGCYTFVVPATVTSISVLVVYAGTNGSPAYSFNCCGITVNSGGRGGKGGHLGYLNNYSVSGGQSYYSKVGPINGSGASGLFNSACCVSQSTAIAAFAGYYSGSPFWTQSGYSGTNNQGGGGYGAPGVFYYVCGSPAGRGDVGGGGGGAAGYTGTGGVSGTQYQFFCACGLTVRSGLAGGSYNPCGWPPGHLCGAAKGGSGGGGGGGASGAYCCDTYGRAAGGGGGVGIYGLGATGVGGWAYCGCCATRARAGGGGSGGGSGSQGYYCGSNYKVYGGNGGGYGGGGAGASGHQGPHHKGCITTPVPGTGGAPALRIVWPGSSRQFPSSDVGS
jgi:hypothetical protein